jgi:HEAT repeat protein
MRQMVSMSLLNEPSSSDRIRGVGFSKQIDQPTETLLTTLLSTLNSDPNVNVRLAAVDAMILFRDRSGVRDELIQSLSRQTSPLVQIALIDLLVQIQEKKALEALRRLIEDEKINPTVKAHAERGIEALI